MAARAKQRLARLIQDLDDGSERSGGASDEEQLEQQALGLQRRARGGARHEAGTDPGEDGASSVSLGLSDLAAESTEDDLNGPAGRDGARAAGRGAGLHNPEMEQKVEQKVMSLLQERRALEARHARELAARDGEAARLRAFVEGELLGLRRRQEEVEARAPLVAAQMADARAALLSGDLMISDERAEQLRAAPEERLGLADAVRLALHGGLQDLRSDNERLRLAGDASREAAAQLEAECARLRRDNARLAAAAAERQADADSSLSSLEARCARLSCELEEAAGAVEVLRAKGRAYDEVEARTERMLEEAAAAVEVLRAKGRVYDEVEARAERMEAEVARLRPFEASAAQLAQRLREAEEGARAAEAREAVAATERAYVLRELQGLRDKADRLEADLAAREEKISDLKRARADLHQRLYDAEAAARAQDDGRMERELARLQAQAAADMGAIRRDASEAADREVRLMRDTRDAAVDEAARLKADLRDLTLAHESLQAASRDARLSADVRIAELVGEAKLRAYELQRAQVLGEERGAALQEARQQIELLDEKVRALTASALALECDRDRTAAELRAQLDAAVGQLAQYEAAEMGLAAAGGAALAPAWQAPGEAASGAHDDAGAEPGGAALRGRPLRALGLQALSARCAQLEAEKGELRRGWREAEGKLARAEADLANVRQRLAAVGQPQKFVLERMAEAQARADDADARARQLQDALEAREAAHAAALDEKHALRSDLQRLLRERGALDSLRSLVAGALGARRRARGARAAAARWRRRCRASCNVPAAAAV